MIALRLQLWTIVGTALLIASVFFFRFYRETRDRFFVLFGLAFVVFGLQYFAQAAWAVPDEARHWLFSLRLAGFLLIVVSVVDKNRVRR